jgi:hypothetical protein
MLPLKWCNSSSASGVFQAALWKGRRDAFFAIHCLAPASAREQPEARDRSGPGARQ